MARTHEDLVGDQFSPRAGAYLASPVHAGGEDLDYLAGLAGQNPGALAIDVGCGGGHVAFRLAPLVGRMVACDPSQAMLDGVAAEAARRGLANLATERSDAAGLPFADGSVDIAASRYSAHHWQDAGAGIARIARVLKPDGLALFADVAAPGRPLQDTWLQTLELLRDPSHVRDYAAHEWQSLLAASGFDVVETRLFRVRLDFASWVARMRTPPESVAAIRLLQRTAPAEVARHFAIEADGSFTIDTLVLAARTGR